MGLIGQHLTRYLAEKGYDILVVDDFSTGQENKIPFPKNVKVWVCSVLNLPKDIEKEKFSHIYNLASIPSPKTYQAFPVRTWSVNLFGTFELANLAVKNKAKFFQASTSEVYGDPLISEQHEDYWGNVNPIGPRACYDESKRAAETLLFDLQRTKGLDIKVARIFNTYGPGMRSDDGRVISNFICAGLQNKPIEIYGNGNQTRSLCYVSDLISGIDRLVQSSLNLANIGNPLEEITVNDLAILIKKPCDSDSEIVRLPHLEDDPKRRCPEITRIKMTGWSPKVSLVDGLNKTIEYFRGIQCKKL